MNPTACGLAPTACRLAPTKCRLALKVCGLAPNLRTLYAVKVSLHLVGASPHRDGVLSVGPFILFIFLNFSVFNPKRKSKTTEIRMKCCFISAPMLFYMNYSIHQLELKLIQEFLLKYMSPRHILVL